MATYNKTSRILGLAFLLQFITSFGSALFVRPTWLVSGDMPATMLKLANSAWLLQANILVDMLTALGIIFLGGMLFVTLRKQNEKLALTALGFYVLEAAVLAASRADAFSLLRFSREYAASGASADWLALGSLAFDSMDFIGSTLHMLIFCPGGMLFYYLLYRSGAVPRALSLWGLIAVFPCLIGTLAAMFGYEVPFALYVPYVPFELVIGVWILVKGIKETSETRVSLGLSQLNA